MDKSLYVGIDIGGTNTAVGIIDADGNILARDSFSTRCRDNLIDFVEVLHDHVVSLADTTGGMERIKGIGIGAPNVNKREEIALCENLPWEMPAPLAEKVRERFGLPVRMANDANAAAMGEMIYGVAKGMKNFICITLGTGVGSGIIADGQLVTGHRGMGGELGHMVIRRERGRKCNCGKSGCLEAYCSAPGVARTAREFLENYPGTDSLLRSLPPEEITSKDIYLAASKGDVLALEVFRFTGDLLGEAMADFMTFSDPEGFVLFGGLAHSGKILLDPLKESFKKHLLQIWNPDEIKILFSEMNGADAALLGAAALAGR